VLGPVRWVHEKLTEHVTGQPEVRSQTDAQNHRRTDGTTGMHIASFAYIGGLRHKNTTEALIVLDWLTLGLNIYTPGVFGPC